MTSLQESSDLCPLGEVPPLGSVPRFMHAFPVREERFGEPRKAFQREIVEVPTELKPDEVLVCVMAAGINYNNVWAGLGEPINVVDLHRRNSDMSGFHIGGSDASGIVYKVGYGVRSLKVGDEVVIHCGVWDSDCPHVTAGNDPMFSPTQRIWGYETNWGSFAQFTKVQAHQCLPKPKNLSWEAAAAYMLVGATAYRMLTHWLPNVAKKDEPILVWGGSGGTGVMAIQIAKSMGARPVAVVSSSDKIEYCMRLGAVGCINRKKFSHFGPLPACGNKEEYEKWLAGARAFGKAIWQILGEKKNPKIVFEHPGMDTLPTSMFVCDLGGMVVMCGATTGYNLTLDARYLWMRQKRLQGSHFANDEQAAAITKLVEEGKVDPCVSRIFEFDELPIAHQLMFENKHPMGNMAVKVGARRAD